MLKKGKVQLRMTKRYLSITGESGAKSLFEVEPYVPTTKQRGLEVRTPQRCNDMATFVTGLSSAVDPGVQAERYLATILRELGHADLAEEYEKAADAYDQDGSTRSMKARGKAVGKMSLEFRQEQANEALPELLECYHLNEFMTPELGAAIATFGVRTLEEEAKMAEESEGFCYHFGSVVAKSGSDYITMENYARRDARSSHTLSSGDPLFFFRMYGEYVQASDWHRAQLETGNFAGAVLSFVVT